MNAAAEFNGDMSSAQNLLDQIQADPDNADGAAVAKMQADIDTMTNQTTSGSGGSSAYTGAASDFQSQAAVVLGDLQKAASAANESTPPANNAANESTPPANNVDITLGPSGSGIGDPSETELDDPSETANAASQTVS